MPVNSISTLIPDSALTAAVKSMYMSRLAQSSSNNSSAQSASACGASIPAAAREAEPARLSSMTATLRPRRASSLAAASPATPPPTTATSALSPKLFRILKDCWYDSAKQTVFSF